MRPSPSSRERSSCVPMELPCRTAFSTTPDGKPGLKADYNEGMRRGPGSGIEASHLSSAAPSPT